MDVHPKNKHGNGKSPCSTGNTSSNGGCSIAMLFFQGVCLKKPIISRWSSSVWWISAAWWLPPRPKQTDEIHPNRWGWFHLDVLLKVCFLSLSLLTHSWPTIVTWLSTNLYPFTNFRRDIQPEVDKQEKINSTTTPPWATLQWAEGYLNRLMHLEWIPNFPQKNHLKTL